MNIFQIKSNIRHNGADMTTGEFIQGELAEFGHLVEAGAMRLFDGVTTIEEAQAVVAQEKADGQNSTANPAAPLEAQDTWGPKKPDPEVPALPADQATSTATNGEVKAPEPTPADVALPAEENAEPGITGEEL